MKILVTGSTGLIGSELVPFLENKGHQVLRLSRVPNSEDEKSIFWNPVAADIHKSKLENLDAVIHLAGENISNARWSPAQKHRIMDSRARGTWFLSQTLAGLQSPPKVYVSGSAIGFYGNRDEELLNEKSLRGKGFLAEVVQAWEKATEPAQEAGIRVVPMRQGIVLSPRGGALGKMLFPFRLGLGGVLGSGEQYMSWISMGQLLGIYDFVLNKPQIEGPVNCVSPRAVTNREFTKTLGRVIRRPTVLPAPAWVLKLVLGQMAEELLLSSQRVKPQTLLDSGYNFGHSDLETELRELLG